MKFNHFGCIEKLVVVCMLCVAGIAVSGFAQSTVTLNVNGAVNPVPKQMFGTLMERLGRQWAGNGSIFVGTSSTTPNVNGMRTDVLDALKECGLGAAQWPGGCAAAGYVWNPPNPANEVGTDRFFQFCQYVGCEPIIAGPFATTSATSNGAWLKHIDSTTAKLGMDSLRWFKIGNEVWGGCGTTVDVNTYCTDFNASYTIMHAYRPSLKYEAGNQSEFGDIPGWLGTLIPTLGTKMDGVEYHDYIYRTTWNSLSFTTPQYWQIMYDGLVGDFAGHIRTNVTPALNTDDPTKRIKLIVDEWGDWLSNDGNWMQTATLMDGMSAANQLHLMMSYSDRIGIACIAQGVNVIHSLININTAGVLTKTPTFYVFKMFKPHHENNAKWVPSTASAIQTFAQATDQSGTQTLPVLNVGSTVDSLGHVNISVCNIDMTATRTITVTLTSNAAQYVIDSAQIVTGAAVNSNNPFGGAEVVNLQNFAASNYTLTNNGKTLTATLPAKSITMFRLKLPPTAVQPGSFRQNGADEFSIKAGSSGTVLITSLVNRKTPVTISLYGVDGSTLIDKVSKTFQAGNSISVLGGNSKDCGVYIVKITGTDINFSKQVMVTR